MSNMDKGQAKLLIGASIVSLVIGYGLGALINGELRWRQGLQEGARQNQIEMAKDLSNSGLLPPELPITELPAKIVSVQGNVLTVEVDNLNDNPFAPPTPSVRTVTVQPDITIIQLTKKPEDQLLKEEAEFFTAEQKFADDLEKGIEVFPPTPVSAYEQKTSSLNDLTPGTFVMIKANENIREATSFEATSVMIRDVAFDTNENIEPTEPEIPIEELAPAPATEAMDDPAPEGADL